jgi:DNA-binding response OmpR family regulator
LQYVAGKAAKETSVHCTGSILIVDHDPTIVDLLIEILTDAGYVAYAAPPDEALAVIGRFPPGLLLLDVCMPGLRGAALIAQVRAIGLARMPIVVLTTTPAVTTPLLIAEVIEILGKPFDLDELLACVGRYVQPAHGALPAMKEEQR